MKKKKIKIKWNNILKLITIILLIITFTILLYKGIEKNNKNYIQKNNCIKNASGDAFKIYQCY